MKQDIINAVKIELTMTIEDNVINHYVEKGIGMAQNISGFETLPNEFESYVIDAVVEALNRRQNEGVTNKSALGVSTTFAFDDMEKSLRSKLRGKRNPKNLIGQYGNNK